MAEVMTGFPDDEMLRRYLAAMQTTPEDKSEAVKLGLLAAGLQLLGARKGEEFPAFSRAGLLGVGTYRGAMDDARQAKQDALRSRAMAMQLAQGEQQMANRQNFLRQFDAAPAASPGYGPGVSAAFGLPQPAPAPAAPQPMSMRAKLKAQGIPDELINAALQSVDPQGEITKLMAKVWEPRAVGDTLYIGGQPVSGTARRDTVPVDYRAGSPTMRPIPGMSEYFAQSAGAEEEAKRAAQSRYTLRDVPVPGSPGQTKLMTEADYLASQKRGPQTFYHGTVTPEMVARSGADRIGMGVTDPMAKREAEANIDTVATATRGANTDFQTNVYRPAMAAAEVAKTSNASLDFIDRLPMKDKTGWTAPAQAYAARVLASIPGMEKSDVQKFAAEADMFNRAVMIRNWEILNTAKGVQTEGDSQRALKTDQQMQGQPEYNQWVRDFTRATNNLASKKAEFYRKGYGKALSSGNPYELEAQWAEAAPSLWDDPALEKWKKYGAAELAEAKASTGALTPAEQKELDDLRKKLGVRR